MKKTALASCMLLLLLVSMFQLFSLAKANPVPYPTEPNQELPTLKVESPNPGEVFKVNNVILKFSVTIPDSWNFYWLMVPVIGTYAVDVYLDGNLHGTYYDSASSYSVLLSRLTRGTHSVKINVEAFTYYDDPSPEPGDHLTYSRNITETIHFTVNADLPTPSPSPTSSPSPKPTPKVDSFPTTLVVASVVLVAVIGMGLLVYFKKRQRGKSS